MLCSDSHDAHPMTCPVFSSIYPDIVQLDPVHADDLIDNVSTGETLPGAGSVGSPASPPIPQLNRKH